MFHWRKNFFLIWSGQAVSLFTSAIVQMAIIWYLTAISGSALVLSIASLIGFLPQAILGPFAGVYIDRHNKKHIMIVADSMIALATLGMIIIACFQDLSIFLVYGILAIRSLGSAFHSPCLAAITPSIVPQDQLDKCAGYSQTLQSVSYILSPILAGVLYATIDLKLILLLDVIGALVALITLWKARIPKQQPVLTKAHVWLETKEGFQVLRKERGLYAIVLLSMIFMIIFMPLNALYPLISFDYFQETAIYASFVEAAFAFGMLLGGIILSLWGGFKKRHITIVCATVLLGSACVIGGLLPVEGALIFVGCSFFMGFSSPFFNGPFMTLIQERIEPQYLGRVFALSGSISSLAMPIGLAICGAFADTVGVNHWFFISDVLIVIEGLAYLCFKEIRKL